MRRSMLRPLSLLAFAGLLAVPQVANAAISITTQGAQQAQIGTVQIPLSATGGVGALTWTLEPGSNLPIGLAIRTDVPSFFPQNGSTTAGIIGVAIAPGDSSFTVRVTDSTAGTAQTATLPITLHITGENFNDLFNIPDAVTGQSYAYTFHVLHGSHPQLSLASGALPLGINLNPLPLTYDISGTPTVPGTYNFTLKITDDTETVFRGFSLRVAAVSMLAAGVLPAGTQGALYTSVPLSPTGGVGPYTYQVTSGSLPQGLSIVNGQITGTVCACANTGRYAFSITITDSTVGTHFTYQRPFSMAVLGATTSLPSVPINSINDATVGNQYSATVSASGGVPPYVWNVTGLPEGMDFRFDPNVTSSNVTPGDVEVFGVPQAIGFYPLTFTAEDNNGAIVSQNTNLFVSPLAYQPADGQNTISLTKGTQSSKVIRIVGGTPPYSGFLASAETPPTGISLTQSNTGIALTGTPTDNGNFSPWVFLTDSGSARYLRSYSLSVAPNNVQINNSPNLGIFSTGTNVSINLNACCAGSLTWTKIDGTFPTGFNISASTGQLTGNVAAGAAGTYTFTIQAVDGSNASNVGTKQFTISFTSVVITTSSLAFGNSGTAYTPVQFAATGTTGSTNWMLYGNGLLPPGMTLSSGGLLSGTPTSAGQYNFTVSVTDSTQEATRFYSLTIYPLGGGPPVSITSPASLGTFTKGILEYDLTATGGNGTFAWSLQGGSSLPPGLALRTDLLNQGATTAILGVATTPGTYSFTLIADSGGQQATRAFTMKITALNAVDGYNLPNAYVGTVYNYSLTPINNVGAASYSLSSGGNAPGWLSVSNLGIISGTPTQAGQFNINVTISDGTDSITRGFSLNVNKIHITNPAILTNATQGQTYTVTLTATGQAGTVTYTANGLPNGLTIQGNVITGTVSSNAFAGLQTVNITAKEGNDSTQQTFSINVAATSPQLPRINFGFIDDAVVGQPYSWSIGECCGGTGPYTWTATGLPEGLSIRYADAGVFGTASGTPSSYVIPGAVEIYGIAKNPIPSTVTLTVTDALQQTTSTSFVMKVSVLDLQPFMPGGTVGVSYNASQHIIGGGPNANYTGGSGPAPGGPLDYYAAAGGTITGGWSSQLLGLPDGLVVTAAGNPPIRITSGAPLESGQFSPVYQVNDGAGHTLLRTNYFTINGLANSISINTSSNLGGAVTNANYSNQLQAFGAASIKWTVTGGTLPPGLTLSQGGLLSGQPNTAGNYSFLLKAEDNGTVVNPAYRAFTLSISSLSITTNSLPFGTKDSPYSKTMTATGEVGSQIWSVGTGSQLPPGLSLSSLGVITGTPTSTGQYYVVFTVADIAGNRTSLGLTLNVYAADGPPVSITSNLNMGTWSIGELQLELAATGGTGSFLWTKEGGALPPGMAIRTDTPSFFSGSASAGLLGVPTAPGTYTFTLKATSGQKSDTKEFTLKITALTTKDLFSLPDAYVGSVYNGTGYTLTALNQAPSSTVIFSTTQASCGGSFPTSCLPPGLALSSSGAITGTPTTPGSYSFNVTLTDGTSTVTHQLRITSYAINITTAGLLPIATQGTAYSSPAMDVTGGVAPYSWAATGLPNGFNMNLSTGAITASAGFSGSPGRYTVQVTVTDSTNPTHISSVKRFLLQVIGVPVTLPQLSLNSQYFDDATVGMPYSATFGVSNGGRPPFNFVATGLPTGMSMRPAIPTQNNFFTPGDIELWGVASAPGTFNIGVTATDADGVTAFNTFPLTVSPMIQDPGLSDGNLGVQYTSTLRILGGSGAYAITGQVKGQLPGGLGRPAFTVTGVPNENGRFSVTYAYSDPNSANNNTLVHTNNFNINNANQNSLSINNSGDLGTTSAGQSYSLTLSATSGSVTWSQPSGTLPPGITLAGNLLSGANPTTPGTYTFLIKADAGSGNTAFRQFTLIVTPITLTTNTTLPSGNVGSPYQSPGPPVTPVALLTTVTAAGTQPVTWALNFGSVLPPGLSITSGAILSGTPTAQGHYSFTLTGTDSAPTGPKNTIVRTFSLDIYPNGGGAPLFLSTSQNLGPWMKGTNYVQLAASGGKSPYTYSLTPGANVVPGCRIQTGPPLPTFFNSSTTGGFLCLNNTDGVTNTSIRVTDANNKTFDRPITVTVSKLMLMMPSTLPRATINVPYIHNPTAGTGVAASGGTGAYQFSVPPNTLPAGLDINPTTGAIFGTPTVAGNFSIPITVGNASEQGTITSNVSLTVNAIRITTSATLPQGTQGTSYPQFQFTASGCVSPCNWTVPGGSTLPTGFNLSNAGVLSTNGGASATDSSFTVQASSVSGNQTIIGQQIVSLVVAPSAITALSISTNITTTSQLGGSAAVGLFAAGGTPPYTFSLESGSLPDGIVLQDHADQVGFLAPARQYLAGRGTVANTFNFTLKVTDGTLKTATKAFSWTISPMSIEYTNLPLSGTIPINTSYTQPLLVVGGSGTYTSWTNGSPFQTGLALNSTTGVIGGTPTTTGSVSSPVTVLDGAGASVISNVNISVVSGAAGTVTLNGGPATGTVIPLGSIQTFNLNPSGGTSPYTITAVGELPAGVLLETGASIGSGLGNALYGIQLGFSTPGPYTFTLQVEDSSAPTKLKGARTFSVIVPDFGLTALNSLPSGSVDVNYSQQMYSFSAVSAVSWSVPAGSALPPGLSISSGGLVSGVPTTAGFYAFNLAYGNGTASASVSLSMLISPLAISSSSSLPPAVASVPYGPNGNGVNLAAGPGANTTWSVNAGGSLPDGLTLSTTGLLSGTPTGNGLNGYYFFGVTAANSGGSVTKQFSIFQTFRNPINLDFPLFQTALADATVGQNYAFTLVPDGGVPDYTWSVANGSALPPGLSLLPAASVVSSGPGLTAIAGAPSVAGTYTFNLNLTDSTTAQITRTFTIKVSPLTLSLTLPSGNPRTATQGVDYSFQFLTTGGTAPYTYAIAANPNNLGQDLLPPGLTFNGATGTISGNPTATGNFPFLVTVTDAANPSRSLTKAVSLSTNSPSGFQINTRNLSANLNSSINIGLSVGGTVAVYDWAVAAPSPTPALPIHPNLPPGVQLLNTAQGWVIQGPATTPGTYQVLLLATNHNNGADIVKRLVTITISPIGLTAPVQNGLFNSSIPNAKQGVDYSFIYRAAGGTPPYHYTESPFAPLPPGMTLSDAGVLSGTPTQSGVFPINPIVTDSAGTLADTNASTTLIVTSPTGKAPLIAKRQALVSDASLGVPFTLNLDRMVYSSEGPITWGVSSGTLPAGLAILPGSNGQSDILAGIPGSVGPGNFTLRATDTVSGQTVDVPSGSFKVSPLAFAPDWIPNAVKGTSYSLFIGIAGGTAPYGVSFAPGMAPPPGMSIVGGLLSGTPAYAGVFPIGLLASDKNATKLTKFYEFSVDDAASEAPSLSVSPKPVKVLYVKGQAGAPTSASVSVTSSTGTLSYKAAIYGVPGATITPENGAGTTNSSVTINYGALTPGNYTGFLAASSANVVNFVDATPVSISVVTPPPCAYTLTTATTSSPIGGDSGNINVSTDAGCSWTSVVDPDNPWITLTGATSGTGSAQVPFTTAANSTGSARTGTVTIVGSTNNPVFTVNQFSSACSFSISPATISLSSAASGATVKITASGPSCSWTASGLSVAPSSGTGTATVDLFIPANATLAPRGLTATIAGQTFTASQTAANCTYALSAYSTLFDSNGGSGSVDITATPAGCTYNTILGPSWINITSGASGVGTAAAQSLLFTVDPNSTTFPRTGALTIGGQVYAITEQALACSVSVDTSTLGSPFPSGLGTGTIGITTNGPNCPWRGVSNNPFAQISPPAGAGSRNVTVTVNSNAGSVNARTGSVTISGQTISFTQAGTACTYALRSPSSSMPPVGGLGTVGVVSPAVCNWNATSNDAWLKIIAKGSGGTADVSFTVDPNTAATPRTGTLTVTGGAQPLTFTVTEGGAPCSYTLASQSSAIPLANVASLVPLNVNYAASTAGCPVPSVTSYSGWIAASSTAYAAPNGTMSFSVEANASGTQRTGNIQVGDKVYKVIQTGGNCSYSLGSYGISINYLGTSSSIAGGASATNCPAPSNGANQPFIALDGLTGDATAGFTLPYTVSPFTSANKTVRQGFITFGGVLFYIKQTSF